LGYVCFSGKLKSESNLQPGPCLASLENTVKLKIEFSLTVKLATQPVKSFQPSFYLQFISVFPHSSHTPLTQFEYSTQSSPQLIPPSSCETTTSPSSTPHIDERERERASVVCQWQFELHCTLRRAASPFSPPYWWVFSPFLLHLTQPNLQPLQARLELCMYLIYKAITLPHIGEALPSSNISDLLFENVFVQACSICME